MDVVASFGLLLPLGCSSSSSVIEQVFVLIRCGVVEFVLLGSPVVMCSCLWLFCLFGLLTRSSSGSVR